MDPMRLGLLSYFPSFSVTHQDVWSVDPSEDPKFRSKRSSFIGRSYGCLIHRSLQNRTATFRSIPFLGGGNSKIFLFSPLLGEMIDGWFNHQPALDGSCSLMIGRRSHEVRSCRAPMGEGESESDRRGEIDSCLGRLGWRFANRSRLCSGPISSLGNMWISYGPILGMMDWFIGQEVYGQIWGIEVKTCAAF